MVRKYQKFKDYLIKELHHFDHAKSFLETAIHEYENDNDIEAFMLALRYLVEAQGGVGKLSERTHLNKQNLYKILSGKTTPRFDTTMSIINGLGFHLSPHRLAINKD